MRVLITAASKHGATSEISTTIACQLTAQGIETTIVQPESIESLEGYDGVVIGSGIYAGHWLEAAKQFVDRHATALAAMPVWLLSSGPLGEPLKPDGEPADVAPILASIGARSHHIFGGRLDRAHLGLGERAVVSLVHAPDGDFRPWDEIPSWSAQIAHDLVPVHATTPP